jgi:hypothetical protein
MSDLVENLTPNHPGRQRTTSQTGCGAPDGDTVLEEVDELDGVLPVGEEEVDALVDVLDIATGLVDAVLQDQLLQEHERPLVVRVLPDLTADRHGWV